MIAQHREYATVGDGNGPRSDDNLLPWPESMSASAPPTPYQIFQMEKTALYSKRRFYELVKLYHPDRHAHFCNNPHIDRLSPDTKMKRYRLVVAANDILSDPSRRRAYDQREAGWSSHSDVGGPAHSWDSRTKARWSGFHDNGSAARNATWEDWEEWYRKDTKPPQTPVYFSNGGFVFLVAFVTAASAVGQASRVDEHKTRFDERAELVHMECNKNLQQRRNETRELSDKDQTALRLAQWRSGRVGIGSGLHQEDLTEHEVKPP
ncbi:MAG: hypothetical protein Q9183_000043 [Haloplaca sp. 2 TL-2023]